MRRVINNCFCKGLFICFLAANISLPGYVSAEENTVTRTPQQLAEIVFNDMSMLAAAVENYREKKFRLPQSTAELMAGPQSIIENMPVYAKELGRGEYSLRLQYDNMDGQGTWDDTLYTGDQIPAAICLEFNKRYASPPLNEESAFDYQSAGNKYPGEVFGRGIKLYAIKWQTTNDACEINWVIRYN